MSEPAITAVKVLTKPELNKHLFQLCELLQGLPTTVPLGDKVYNFVNYQPSEEDCSVYGDVGAVNHDLEVAFCSAGRQVGPIVLLERGQGLTAIVDVLRKYTQAYPLDMVLQKWILDLMKAARDLKAEPVPIDPTLSIRSGQEGLEDCAGSDGDSESEDTDPVSVGWKRAAPRSAPVKAKTQRGKRKRLTAAAIMADYSDCERAAARGRGGHPKAAILDEVSVFTRMKSDPDPTQRYWRCAGAVDGCDTRWKGTSRAKGRVLMHASQCSYLSQDIRQRANTELGMLALGAQVTVEKPVEGSNDSEVKLVSVSRAASSLAGLRTPSVASSQTSTPGPSSASTSRLQISSVPAKPRTSSSSNNSRQPSVITAARWAGQAQLQKLLDFHIMKFFVVAGIPPSKVDLPEWKELWQHANHLYHPVSGSTMEDTHIPREAAHIKNLTLEQLQAQENLTISFDGGTTKATESVYTIHILTADRRVFLWEGNEASHESHTAEHLYCVLKGIIETVGPRRFRGITSDNTGNTHTARELIQKDYPWIIILPDPCHRLSLLCKDIGKITYFSTVIKDIRATVKYFKKSSFASAHLRTRRRKLNIGRGLVSVGKTRFATMYFSGESVRRCLPAISELVTEKIVTVPNINSKLMSGMGPSKFKYKLEELVATLAPIAKSTTCLESSHSTVSDVYIFWLAVMAELHALLTDSNNELETEVKEEIRMCANYRFRQMIDNAPDDVYPMGFVIDPRFRGADILDDLNPLAIARIKIGPQAQATASGSVSKTKGKSKADADEIPDNLRRAGKYLLHLLRIAYEHRGGSIAGMDTYSAISRLKEQLRKFVKSVYPFDRPLKPSNGPQQWWERLNTDTSNDAQPLAHLATVLFSLTPNSMNDERTSSTFTWLNSPLRNQMKVPTLVRTVQIRQWYRHKPGSSAPPYRPIVKYRDMAKTIFNKSSTSTKRQMKPTSLGATDADDEEDRSESDSEDEYISDDSEEDDGHVLADASGVQRSRIAVGEHANLASLQLRDFLLDTPLAVEHSPISQTVPFTAAQNAVRTIEEADWEM